MNKDNAFASKITFSQKIEVFKRSADVGGKLVATDDLKRGEVFLREFPVYAIPLVNIYDDSDDELRQYFKYTQHVTELSCKLTQMEALAKVVLEDSRDRDTNIWFASLCESKLSIAAHVDSIEVFTDFKHCRSKCAETYRRVEANAHTVSTATEQDVAECLYPLSCRMNHSCSSNAISVVGSGLELTWIAMSDVSKGEELTTSYMSGIEDVCFCKRHPELKRQFGFSCICTQCRTECIRDLKRKECKEHRNAASMPIKAVLAWKLGYDLKKKKDMCGAARLFVNVLRETSTWKKPSKFRFTRKVAMALMRSILDAGDLVKTVPIAYTRDWSSALEYCIAHNSNWTSSIMNAKKAYAIAVTIAVLKLVVIRITGAYDENFSGIVLTLTLLQTFAKIAHISEEQKQFDYLFTYASPATHEGLKYFNEFLRISPED